MNKSAMDARFCPICRQLTGNDSLLLHLRERHKPRQLAWWIVTNADAPGNLAAERQSYRALQRQLEETRDLVDRRNEAIANRDNQIARLKLDNARLQDVVSKAADDLPRLFAAVSLLMEDGGEGGEGGPGDNPAAVNIRHTIGHTGKSNGSPLLIAGDGSPGVFCADGPGRCVTCREFAGLIAQHGVVASAPDDFVEFAAVAGGQVDGEAGEAGEAGEGDNSTIAGTGEAGADSPLRVVLPMGSVEFNLLNNLAWFARAAMQGTPIPGVKSAGEATTEIDPGGPAAGLLRFLAAYCRMAFGGTAAAQAGQDMAFATDADEF